MQEPSVGMGASRGDFIIESYTKGKVVSKIWCKKKVKQKQRRNFFSFALYIYILWIVFTLGCLPKTPFYCLWLDRVVFTSCILVDWINQFNLFPSKAFKILNKRIKFVTIYLENLVSFNTLDFNSTMRKNI